MFDPKTAWESSPNRPKKIPRGYFCGLKFAPRFFNFCLLHFGSQNDTLWDAFWLPKPFKKIRINQSTPKATPRPPQFRPKTAQEAPRGSQESPRKPKKQLKRFQKHQKDHLRTPQKPKRSCIRTQQSRTAPRWKLNQIPRGTAGNVGFNTL